MGSSDVMQEWSWTIETLLFVLAISNIMFWTNKSHFSLIKVN